MVIVNLTFNGDIKIDGFKISGTLFLERFESGSIELEPIRLLIEDLESQIGYFLFFRREKYDSVKLELKSLYTVTISLKKSKKSDNEWYGKMIIKSKNFLYRGQVKFKYK